MQLTTAILWGFEGNREAEAAHRRLEHRALKAFEAKGTSTLMCSLLNQLTLPSLEILMLAIVLGDNSPLSLVDFFECSNPHSSLWSLVVLKSLVISCSQATCRCHVQFIEALHAVPRLENLVVPPSLLSLFS